MPLGQRAGDKSDSRYCGVEADFIDDMPHLLTHSLSGGFDFIVSPLVDPNYRPSLSTNNAGEGFVLPVAASDLIVSPAQWSSHVVGKISPWIDLDSENEKLRMDSEMALKQEISWASHLSVQKNFFAKAVCILVIFRAHGFRLLSCDIRSTVPGFLISSLCGSRRLGFLLPHLLERKPWWGHRPCYGWFPSSPSFLFRVLISFHYS